MGDNFHDVANQSVSVLAVGSEILDGRVQDTNSQWIAAQLSNIGVRLEKTLVCDDNQIEIAASLSFLSKTSSIIIVSGGLGPTTDDVTREAIAEFVGVPLIERPESLTRLRTLYEKRKRVLDPSNNKQAVFPQGASVFLNEVGTAEGFVLIHNSVTICSLPGVPKELKPMFLSSVLPIISQTVKGKPICRRSFRVFGLPESDVGSKIKSLHISDDIFVSYRASFPEIHVVLKGSHPQEVYDAAEAAKDIVGRDNIFVEDREESLPQVVGALLSTSNYTISVAESCTGGMLGGYLTSVAGSSKYFLGGYVTYSNQRKIDDLQVSPDTLSEFGAVSEQVACEMAVGTRQVTKSDIAISITGIAGPDGGSIEKPVGAFYIGISTKEKTYAVKNFFLSDRSAIRIYAAYRALDLVRRFIAGSYPDRKREVLTS